MELKARDLARLIELNKKKAELEFQVRILGAKPDVELRRVVSNANELAEKAKAAGISLIFPNQTKLDEYAEALDAFPADAIKEGLKIRDGRAYQTLKERGIIVKKNFENRSEIAKLLIIIAGMAKDEREAIESAISAGSIESPVSVASLGEESGKRIARFMRRCGIACVACGTELKVAPDEAVEKETRIELPNRWVWVSEGSKALLEENLRKMQHLNARIQLKNAERQIKTFSEEEEGVFATLQMEYLVLLKEQDELLREFNEEDALAVKAQ
ncbi:MAG: hypothetical protein V1861_07150 [Candidatus Micrarchaeota archaeon]